MNKHYLLYGFLLFLIMSCAGYQYKYISTDDYYFIEKKKKNSPVTVIGIKSDEDKGITADIMSPLIPAVTIHGEAVFVDYETVVIKIASISVLSNWPNGWTSCEWEASGIVNLEKSDDIWKCSIKEPVERWDIKKGEIRYYDTYFRNQEGLQKTKNRVERIDAVCRYLHEEELFPDLLGSTKKDTNMGRGMNKILIPYLFPETLDTGKRFSKRRNDGGFAYTGLFSEFLYGAEMLWSEGYTKAVFPDNLHTLRNSGTIWRDYEESPELFLSIFNMNYYFSNILNNSIFEKNKP